jgi:branched-chain amino acid transport system ATP-binding protein
LLQVSELSVYYGSALALDRVSLKVDEGEIVSVTGPNCAGKTTLLRAISGLLNLTYKKTARLSGKITFNGERIDHLTPDKIARRGLILCPDGKRPFREMTVIDNLRAGGYLCRNKEELKRNLEIVFNLFPVLKLRSKQIAGTLSGGEQTMLAIGRALMAQPKLLCIDEPSAGLAPLVAKSVFEKLKEITRKGISILLVEQNVKLAFSISDRNYILSGGRIVAEGTSQELLKNDVIRKSYLGL